MRKKTTPKLRIKNLPRFLTFSAMSLIILVIITMSLFFLMNKMAEAFNTQKQILQTSSANSSDPNAAKTETVISNNQQNAKTETKPQVTDDDPLADIKARLRSGDTAGIKVVFLTFDDGPSENTGALLDILNEYDAKGTFFTTLHDNDNAKAMYRRIVDEGHTLANHTSSHDYGLYSNPEAFFADVEELDQFQKSITGQTETSHVFRFPGGSTNSNEACVQGIVSRGFNYSDWNVSSGDGCSDPPPSDVIAQMIIEGCRENDVSVVLCHAELKESSRNAIPIVIETLQAEGYVFLPMEKDYTYPRHLEV
ncbi:polysaccharide deacetylase family protein [Acetobacterium wieringae]|uniref:Peptidoglycan-N-acetylglucosamine deacetylase n=1 Tax=Acetobacterium wieringae TaxID=52694 RepID=A0A1F2PLQ9_9FIRM|nr:polysaccharide deacetylase family protein [Acetobacterium wieringae]OFV71616.1 peptidoglycan-N-acetylglucosamine deacetylase [Acetobacterium wieringae]